MVTRPPVDKSGTSIFSRSGATGAGAVGGVCESVGVPARNSPLKMSAVNFDKNMRDNIKKGRLYNRSAVLITKEAVAVMNDFRQASGWPCRVEVCG